MNMISYWKDVKEIYEPNGFKVIIGRYDHKNEHNGGMRELGVYWPNHPISKHPESGVAVLSPCVVPQEVRNAILQGLLYQAVTGANTQQAEKVTEAIEFFQENS